jgi:hypothetical protein
MLDIGLVMPGDGAGMKKADGTLPRRECLDFCVMSHTLPERVRSRYREEHNGRIFEGAVGSAGGGT